MNIVILTGNLGIDPEVKTLENNTKVATFSLASSEVYYDKQGQKQTITDWHNIKCWKGLAERAEKYLKKGSHITLQGKLKTDSYEDKDGKKQYWTYVLADSMDFGPKPSETPAQKTGATEETAN